MTTRRIERFQVVVIGAGQAGLSAGYWLAKHDIDFVIVDAHPRVGEVWRQRWDSLQLFTPARYSGLPGMPFPGAPSHLPGRNEVADYLEWYAQAFDLPVRVGVRISRVRRMDRFFEISGDGLHLEAENVIVATGPFQIPRIPAFASDLDPSILQVHSNNYRNPAQLPPGHTLVVGAANSGAQIALELSDSRRVILAGRDVGYVPRRLLGLDIFDWMWHTVMRPGANSAVGRRIRRHVLAGGDPLIGMTSGNLDRPNLRRVAHVTGVRNGQPLFGDGRTHALNCIVWATGFRPDFSWIDLPIFDDAGFPRHTRGVVIDAPGLFFLGLRFLHRLNSSLIGGVGADARYVASSILARYGS